MDKKDIALKYLKDYGFSVIPVKKDKKPYIKWELYQKQHATEDEIEGWFKQWPDANIGIVTGEISNLAVIDIDTEEGRVAIQDYIPDSIEFPIVHTPSGGMHYYFKCPDSKISNNARVIAGCDLRANGGYVVAPPSTNGNGKSYCWNQKALLSKKQIPNLPQAYITYINNSIYSLHTVLSKNESKASTSDNKMFTQGRRDNDIFHVANALFKAGLPYHEVSQVVEILANNCTPKFNPSEIAIKVESAMKRDSGRILHITSEVREFVVTTFGHFSTTDVYNFMGLSTRDNKKKVSVCLGRMVDEGIIERVGNKNGQFRRVENNFVPITTFDPSDITPIKLEFPLDLHEYAKIYQGNVIILAGEKSTGKSGYCLSFATMNQDHPQKVRYISSEFGSGELLERLEPMNIDTDKWIKNVEFNIFRGEPQDAISPNAINIVDYLEVKDGEFFKIGSQIDKIFNKLKKGIALIALQMTPGQEFARGGAMTLDKARLYFTLTRLKTEFGGKNICTIIDIKNRVRKELNYNHHFAEYKLGGGHHFKRLTTWLPR